MAATPQGRARRRRHGAAVVSWAATHTPSTQGLDGMPVCKVWPGVSCAAWVVAAASSAPGAIPCGASAGVEARPRSLEQPCPSQPARMLQGLAPWASCKLQRRSWSGRGFRAARASRLAYHVTLDK
eukprot:170005-Chlamydomonas_euryale.AAC.4